MELTTATGSAIVPAQRAYRITKRAMDIGISLLVLALVWPLWFILSILIRLGSKGPALFIQERVGKNCQPFCMYKFRTLHVKLDNAAHEAYMRSYVNGRSGEGETSNAAHKPVTDSQVTTLGHFLRQTSLDELPQLLNVLKGEMSLVGPRPNVPWEVEEYQPWHRRRLEVLPGMTGLAQVRGRSCISFDDIVEYDIKYIEQQSLLMDLRILWWTMPMVLRGIGAK